MINKTKRSIQWVKQAKKQNHVGVHVIAEFWYGKIIEDPQKIENILRIAAKKANSVPLQSLVHKFSPQGLTGVVLLEESHIAIHTWPEIDYLAIDIFTCGKKVAPEKALAYLQKVFKPKKLEIKNIKRGKTSQQRARKLEL